MKLVFISDKLFRLMDPKPTYLKVGEIYEGEYIKTIFRQDMRYGEVIVKCSDDKHRRFHASYFMELEEWREIQINKILNI
jgi:hypothetical protein